MTASILFAPKRIRTKTNIRRVISMFSLAHSLLFVLALRSEREKNFFLRRSVDYSKIDAIILCSSLTHNLEILNNTHIKLKHALLNSTSLGKLLNQPSIHMSISNTFFCLIRLMIFPTKIFLTYKLKYSL